MERGNRRRLKYTSNTKSRAPPKNMNNHTKTTIRVVSPPPPPPPPLPSSPISSTPTPTNSNMPSSMQTIVRNSTGKNTFFKFLFLFLSLTMHSNFVFKL